MKKSLLTLGIFCALQTPAAFAEIYKVIDENGKVTYTNMPVKGAKKLDIDPPPTNGASTPSREVKTSTPSSFPRVDKQTQNQRDNTRKQILQAELEAEKKALEEAKKAYEEGASKPEVYKGAGGKTYRNVAKFEDKMKQLQANVDAHEKNIQLLQKELDTLN
ncbi:MAG: DUF4124 domain-containing protein [Betaproteobacteria bacterium HGW-Betaproteobacteria-8]|nr:MAG: DUF4124 domain-containing protein [Betaproteobacteria bacterium HGW-Betaproteobacteria-8]